jgi:hypothetical protein
VIFESAGDSGATRTKIDPGDLDGGSRQGKHDNLDHHALHFVEVSELTDREGYAARVNS